MADITALFDLKIANNHLTSTKDDWFEIMTIPNNKQVFLGWMTCIAWDKNLTFEIRSNLPTKSAASVAETELLGFGAATSGDSNDIDCYLNGQIVMLAPSTQKSTGVEKLWLRVRSVSVAASNLDYLLYYTWN